VGLLFSLSLAVGRSVRAKQPRLFLSIFPVNAIPYPCALSFLDSFLAAVAPLLSLRITAGHDEQRDLALLGPAGQLILPRPTAAEQEA
jgi:hypothetical protein